MTVIYSVHDIQGDETEYFAKKDEACGQARFIAEFSGWVTDVVMHETAQLPERDLVIALLRKANWSGKSEVVYTARPKIKRALDPDPLEALREHAEPG